MSEVEPEKTSVDREEGPASQTVPTPVELKRAELIDRVVAASGVRKSDAKPIVEATLMVMGQALSAGESLNLQPFGKLKTTRRRDLPNGQALTIKLRRSAAAIARADASILPDERDA